MPLFRYAPPDEAEAPPVSEYMGLSFETNGRPTLVEPGAVYRSTDICASLSHHPHFVEVDGEGMPPNADAIDDWRVLDKAALDAYADGLGVKLDRRRSLENMQADFEAALNARG